MFTLIIALIYALYLVFANLVFNLTQVAPLMAEIH